MLAFLLLIPIGAWSSGPTRILGRSEDKESIKCSVAGIVVKDPSGEPLKKALIEIVSRDQDGVLYSTTSDVEGHFKIEDVAPGRYAIGVEKTGFIAVDRHGHEAHETAITLEAKQQLSGILLKMSPAAVIRGRVVDEDGDPMPNVDVSVLHHGYTLGHQGLESVRTTRTDDIGEYRMAGLISGRYIIVATPPMEYSGSVVGSLKAESPSAPENAYVTTYYPGTTDDKQAASLETHAGDELNVDFTMIKSPTVHVRGTVKINRTQEEKSVNSPGMVSLQQLVARNVPKMADIAQDGSFEMSGVAPGSYVVHVNSGDDELLRQQIEVGNSDVNLRLAPEPLTQVQGQVRVEDGSRIDFSSLYVFVKSDEGIALNGFSYGEQAERVKSDGRFELKNVPAGTYTVQVVGQTKALRDYYLKAAIAGGRDITGGWRISGGPVSLDLVLSAKSGQVEGLVLDQKDKPAPGVTVVAVPSAEHRRQRFDHYYRSVTDQRGGFSLRGMVPDDYTVYAWESVEDGAYYDPDFIKKYEDAGKVVHVKENGRESLSVKAIPETLEEP